MLRNVLFVWETKCVQQNLYLFLTPVKGPLIWLGFLTSLSVTLQHATKLKPVSMYA